MSAAPAWRRLSPGSAPARVALLAALLAAAGLLALLVVFPLLGGLRAAEERAARLDLRAGALFAAAAERRAEAGLAGVDPASAAAAEAWLAEVAPERDREAAMLDLLSALRLLAGAAAVELVSAAPLERAASFPAPEGGPVGVVAAEARIVADHAGLARFLEAVEAARPVLRAAALDISAASPAAGAEARRLSVSVTVGALFRPDGG